MFLNLSEVERFDRSLRVELGEVTMNLIKDAAPASHHLKGNYIKQNQQRQQHSISFDI